MSPSRLLVAVLLVALSGPQALATAPASRRPRVDREAMREAMDAAATDDGAFSSSASYTQYLRARLLHHAGDHRGAVDALRLALATDDGHPLLLTRLAEEYARLGDLDKAERELRRAVERSSAYYPAHVLLGRVLMESGRFTRARLHLRRAVALKPREPEAYLVLAQLYLESGSPGEAVKVVESLSRALPGEASGYRRLGLALAERGDTARAERLLSEAATRDPGDVEVLGTLAKLYEETGRPGKAEETLAKALEREPDSQEVLLAAGRSALKAGSPVRARAYFDRLLSLSGEPETAVRVAFSYLSEREPDAAVQVLETARSASDGEPRLAYYVGLVHERLRRFPEAAKAFASVPEGSDIYPDARVRLAKCLSLSGQHPRALALLRAALQDSPDDLEVRAQYARALERGGTPARAESVLKEGLSRQQSAALYDALAATLQRQGRGAEALVLLREALARMPKDPALQYVMGAAFERQGDMAGAQARMRAVLEVEPDHAPALNFLGYLLAQSGRHLDEAERLVLRALELRPDNGAFLDSLGWVYFRRGDYPRAVEVLERASTLAPDEPVILEHLGDAYQRAARGPEAAGAWRRALEVLSLDPESAEPPGQREALERKLKALSTGAAGR
ncbi:tetratricopeptide repeat protein [Myxococcus sp. MISCRS1]|uniref:tetratricopeptide repeat protein n=1 Tax=unclassified Myxococcus TaxID=2648731 RepID=UPI001CBE1117|nr:tetratricopeptide repeat protein [Myxococcus sp. MISCRS1]MBZ4414133.1 tetratricopeptide repeat protein [Myxococcus sp. XM-1-1-1]MCY1002657.1 tetratricopeptide repeat protein [Myxococcus sp. MISCRS1]